MELIVDSSAASEAVLLAAYYFGLVKDQRIVIKRDGSSHSNDQIPRLHLADGLTITEAIVIIKYLASLIRRDIADSLYNIRNQPELDRWLSFAAEKNFQCSDASTLHTLNSHLSTSSFFAAQHITIVDLVLFSSIHQWMVSSSARERLSNQNITRWYNHIQHLPGIYQVEGIPIPFIEIEVDDGVLPTFHTSLGEQQHPREKQTENKKEKKTGSVVKKEKSHEENDVKGNKVILERPLDDVTRLEIRVGFIIKAWNHPDADTLYCEEIDIGEPQPRKIASGLREHISRENFEGQKVLVLCNMKEKKLRGFPSHGMILCGKKDLPEGREKIELVRPMKDAKIGERVLFDGLSGEPDLVMNTKTGKDPFTAVQAGFHVDNNGIAYYKEHKFSTSAGDCTCDTIRGGSIS